MPVPANDTEIVHVANGVATVFPYPFYAQVDSDIAVSLDGVPTSGYTVAGLLSPTGGSVTFGTAPANGVEVLIALAVPYERSLVDYQPNGAFAADTVDFDVDRVVLMAQQLATAMKRVPALAPGASLAGLELTPDPLKLLQWNGAGTAIVGVDPVTISPSTVTMTAYAQTLAAAASAAAARDLLGRLSEVHGPQNIALSFSVATNALTIALKGHDGADHSTSNVGRIPFRNIQLSSGDVDVVEVTSAHTLTTPAGATIGNVINAQPVRIWVVAFNDFGTLRLGVMCPLFYVAAGAYDGTGGPLIYPLMPSGRADAVSISAASDNSGTFYAGATISARAYTVLGYFEYTAGLATAGNYNIVPDGAAMWAPGMRMPGETVKYQRVLDADVLTGTTILPIDDTIPQITEGVLLLSLTFYQSSLCNLNLVNTQIFGASSNLNATGALTLHVSGVNNALAATLLSRPGTNGVVFSGSLQFAWLPNVFPIAYTVRSGTASAGTFTFNGSGGGRLHGGRAASYLEVTEIMV